MPAIKRTINFLKEDGIRKIYVVASKNADFESLEGVEVIPQKAGRGTGSALESVELGGEFIVLNGDIVFDHAALSALETSSGCAMLSKEVQDSGRFGILNIGRDGKLSSILEKQGAPGPKPINCGMYKLNGEVYECLKRTPISPRGEKEITTAINLLSEREPVSVVRNDGIWFDLGRPWDLLEANRALLDSAVHHISGDVSPTADITGRVTVERGATVLPYTRIEGPAFIGRDSKVGPFANIRPYTVVGHGAKIGSFVEIKESVIMENARIPHLSYVGDSIICEGANLGAGTKIANLRFDRKMVKTKIKDEVLSTERRKFGSVIGGYAQTGVNVSILPGVKLGAHSKIYPGSVVDRDVAAEEFFTGSPDGARAGRAPGAHPGPGEAPRTL